MNFSVNKRVKNRVTRLHFSQARWAFLLLFILSLSTLADDGDDLSQEPPPVRSGEQYIYLGKEQSTEITINQKPGEFTLLVLEAQGVDFTMELLNPKTEPGPQYYNDTWFESYLNINFLLKSSDCETCKIKITTSYIKERSIPFLVRHDTFNHSVHKQRLWTEKTVQNNLLNVFDYTPFDYDNFLLAAFFLENSENNHDRLRACFYNVKIIYNLYANVVESSHQNQITQMLDQLLACKKLAKKFGNKHIANLAAFEYFRFSQDFSKGTLNSHLQSLNNIINEYELLISSGDDAPAKHFVLSYGFFLKGLILSRLANNPYYRASEQYYEVLEKFINHSNNAGSIHFLKLILPHYSQKFSDLSMIDEAYFFINYSIELHKKTANNNFRKIFPVDFLFSILLNSGDFYHANRLLLSWPNEEYDKYYHLSSYVGSVQLHYALNDYQAAEHAVIQFLNLLDHNQSQYLLFAHHLLANIYQTTEQTNKAISALKTRINLLKPYKDIVSQSGVTISQIRLALLENQPSRAIEIYRTLPLNLFLAYDLDRVLRYKVIALEQLGKYKEAYKELNEWSQHAYYKDNKAYSVQIQTDLTKFAQLAQQPPEVIRGHTEKALQLFESLRTTQASIQTRRDVLASQRQLFELTMATELENNDTSTETALAALFSAETFKARTLYDIFINNVPLPAQEVSSGSVEAVETILNAAIERHQTYFAKNADTSNNTRPHLNINQLRDYQQKLDKRQGVLYFISGESFGRVWLITQSTIESYASPEHSKLSQAVNEFLAFASQRPAGGQLARSSLTEHQQRVSRLLLSDLGEQLAELDQLTIVPDASLHRLPFSFLVNPSTKQPLIETTQLRYASSIATDQWLNQAPDPELQSPKLLVVANPTPNDSNAIAATHTSTHQTNKNSGAEGPLANNQAALAPIQRFGGRQGIPGADREAHALIDLWQQRYQQGQSQLLRGSQATKQSLLAEPLDQYQILHFATHAEVDWDNPQLSAIQLASNAEQELLLDTPHLSVGEISQLELNAALVVLSACDTASGKLITGEGPIGLSRAFIEAGAKRVLSTLWPVDDEATALLQEKFYQGLLTDNLTPAEALRQAQLFIRNQPQYQHPYFWAGFMFIGKADTW